MSFYLQWNANGENGPIGGNAPNRAAEETKSAQGVLINKPSMGALHALERLQKQEAATHKLALSVPTIMRVSVALA